MKCLFFASILFCCGLNGFDRVVLWGYKLHTHTHSYIHDAFYRAFKHLGYEVQWYDDNDTVNEEDFANSLFISALVRSKNIPLRKDCLYIVHTNWSKDFSANDTKFAPLINQGHCVLLKCFQNEYLDAPEWEKLAPCLYRNIARRELAMPWATDLLPFQIDLEKERLKKIKPIKRIAFLGTIGKAGNGANYKELINFFRQGRSHGYSIKKNDPWSHPIPTLQMKNILQESMLAPAIQGKWQVDVGYIPCRIFKNLSYGCLGITNSERVWELFNHKIVYDPDTKALFYKAEKALKNYTLEKRFEMMDYIKYHHTYLNRIKALLELLYDCCGDESIKEAIENSNLVELPYHS
ncbi:MAG: hypothetical protein ChlgKO_05350 [Chlamydiales bacterium]